MLSGSSLQVCVVVRCGGLRFHSIMWLHHLRIELMLGCEIVNNLKISNTVEVEVKVGNIMIDRPTYITEKTPLYCFYYYVVTFLKIFLVDILLDE